MHASKARKYIMLHDTSIDAEVGVSLDWQSRLDRQTVLDKQAEFGKQAD